MPSAARVSATPPKRERSVIWKRRSPTDALSTCSSVRGFPSDWSLSIASTSVRTRGIAVDGSPEVRTTRRSYCQGQISSGRVICGSGIFEGDGARECGAGNEGERGDAPQRLGVEGPHLLRLAVFLVRKIEIGDEDVSGVVEAERHGQKAPHRADHEPRADGQDDGEGYLHDHQCRAGASARGGSGATVLERKGD